MSTNSLQHGFQWLNKLLAAGIVQPRIGQHLRRHRPDGLLIFLAANYPKNLIMGRFREFLSQRVVLKHASYFNLHVDLVGF
jgi:hypothetical protein